ncbi:MAG: CRTAC1 family protein, partial [Solirubrobacterales bacterium]
RGHIVIRTIGIPGGAQLELGFTERQVVAGSTENAEVEIGRRDAGFGAKVLVEAGPTATAVLIPRHLDLPIRVRVTDAVPLDQVAVGAELVRPSAHGFDLRFRDRHGIAWGDYDGDGSSDAFIAGGGLSSEIDAYKAIVADELLLGGGEGGAPSFTDAYDDSRLRKGACRTREAAAFDYDLDGTTDLFLSCEGGLPRLALGRKHGKFRDRSGLIRIIGDAGRGPAYRWVELNGDPGLELAVATEEGLRLYEREAKALELVAELGGRHSRGIGNIAVGDFDSDSDADLLVPSAGGTTLYTNRRGALTPRDPRKFGLPGARVRAASWIDYDNDGRLDLHAHPRGLYAGSASGGFERTPFLRLPEPNGEARVSWFDADTDGDLEPVSTSRVRDSNRWVPLRYENTGRTRHWIAVDLGRPGGSPTALGARVRVRTADGVSTSWVGAREGARYSSGNYRVHFGLANRRSARWLKIDWPDGTRQRIKDPEIDRVLLVEPPQRTG